MFGVEQLDLTAVLANNGNSMYHYLPLPFLILPLFLPQGEVCLAKKEYEKAVEM